MAGRRIIENIFFIAIFISFVPGELNGQTETSVRDLQATIRSLSMTTNSMLANISSQMNEFLDYDKTKDKTSTVAEDRTVVSMAAEASVPAVDVKTAIQSIMDVNFFSKIKDRTDETMEEINNSYGETANAVSTLADLATNNLAFMRSMKESIETLGNSTSFGPTEATMKTIREQFDNIHDQKDLTETIILFRYVARCPADYRFSAPNHYCMKHIHTKKTWADARIACQAHNGDLVVLDSQEKRNFANIISNGRVHVGATDADGTWKWLGGSVVDGSAWRRGEPTNGQGEDCAVMIKGLLQDESCSDLREYLCEITITL